MTTRVSSLDEGYEAGDLSVYPLAIDTKNTLYKATNNAETKLKQSLAYNGKHIIIEDASNFPSDGLLRIGPEPGEREPGQHELIYYGKWNSWGLTDLIRGFAGSKQNFWPAGSHASNAVFAEHHNAVKDSIINIEEHLGLKDFPDENSLNGILKNIENKYLSPKPSWRSYPRSGPPPLSVRFQNFSGGDAIRFLWDFGDGSTSIEKNPDHTYVQEGIYTVKLNIITSSGAQGFAIKSNYITVNEDEKIPFFYVTPDDPASPNYSVETAAAQTALGNPSNVQTFNFVDQTDGDIVQRFWIFDDGTNVGITDPDIHSFTHDYEKPGNYEPSLLIVFSSQKLKRIFMRDEITIL